MISAFGTPTLLLCGRDEGISDPLHNLAVFSDFSVIMTLEMLVPGGSKHYSHDRAQDFFFFFGIGLLRASLRI
ncbi:hypothetical protein BJY00DRAFT_282035 [Aspergillus carlsbadensis]|nr:hypothetical protein BJY00DRAFT_282035 [Aspergillus carlsbadensis]